VTHGITRPCLTEQVGVLWDRDEHWRLEPKGDRLAVALRLHDRDRERLDAGAPACSSQVGASVLATAMVQVPWILDYICRHVGEVQVRLSWEAFVPAQSGLLLWEAFVSGPAKGKTHEEDARNGVRAFCDQLPTPGDDTAAETPRPFSLLAAAAVWAGCVLPLADLRLPCVLVRAVEQDPPAAA